MIKPAKLNRGDTIATISPSWGCAGAPRVRWKYWLGCQRLAELGLNVVSAPNALKGTSYLRAHPEARAEDILWAFENKNVKAIIANVGGNDAIRLLPYLSADVIRDNPKIFCGYSDVMTLHLYCHRLGLMTYYGDNLLTTVAETGQWHPYSRHWFEKTFFDDAPIGRIDPSDDWSWDLDPYTDRSFRKTYMHNPGYRYVQGKGTARGKLFGGHGDMRSLRMPDGSSMVGKDDFEGSILFFEDIPELCDVHYMAAFIDWLGENGFLQVLHGIIIGKMRMKDSFQPYVDCIRVLVTDKYDRPDLPILADVNFGHASPMAILPYGAQAEIDVDHLRFTILESGVR